MMRLPSGDQTGQESSEESNVNREELPRDSSSSQMSKVLFRESESPAATRFPSGDSEKESYLPSGLAALISRPPRSNHTSWVLGAPLRYTRVLSAEMEK